MSPPPPTRDTHPGSGFRSLQLSEAAHVARPQAIGSTTIGASFVFVARLTPRVCEFRLYNSRALPRRSIVPNSRHLCLARRLSAPRVSRRWRSRSVRTRRDGGAIVHHDAMAALVLSILGALRSGLRTRA